MSTTDSGMTHADAAATTSAATTKSAAASTATVIPTAATIIGTAAIAAVVVIAVAPNHPAQHAGDHSADDRFRKDASMLTNLLDIRVRLYQMRCAQ